MYLYTLYVAEYAHSCSLSEAKLEGVIIELARELVVVLWLNLLRGGGTEHGRKVVGLRVDLLGAAGLAHVVLEGVRVDHFLNGLPSVVHHIVSRCEIALLKGLLGGTVTDQHVVLDATLHVSHGVRVLVVFLLVLFKTCWSEFIDFGLT